MTLRRPDEWRRRESNPLLLGASEVLRHQSFVPERRRGGPRCGEVRAGGVEPPQLEAPGLQPGELAGCSAPARRGDRPGSNRRRGDHSPGCFPLHHGHHVWALLVAALPPSSRNWDGDDRTRTGGLSPDKRALCSLSYAPFRDVNGRSGSTASSSMSRPLRLDRRRDESGWQESNLRSPAPEAGGVASSPTARCPTSAARPARGA